MRALVLFLLLAACNKKQADATKWGEPVGIELAGQDVMAAVAVEAPNEIDSAAMPELATALSAVAKSCPDVKTIGTNTISIKMSAKDGVLVAPTDPTSDALSQCVTHELDGKPAKKLGTTKLYIQIAQKGKP